MELLDPSPRCYRICLVGLIAVVRCKSNKWCEETYVLITSSVVFLNLCTLMVKVSQSLFVVYLGVGAWGKPALTAVMSPLSTVDEFIIVGLRYTMSPERFGGGTFLVFLVSPEA